MTSRMKSKMDCMDWNECEDTQLRNAYKGIAACFETIDCLCSCRLYLGLMFSVLVDDIENEGCILLLSSLIRQHRGQIARMRRSVCDHSS
jgi:hypothetical protein